VRCGTDTLAVWGRLRLRGSQVPPDATPHSLRHTFATRYLATHPHDLVGLARLLGHSALEATRVYVQPTDDKLATRVERLDLNAYAR
jgi:integrase